METLKILTVDDEEGIRTGIRRSMRNQIVSFPFHDDDFEYEIIDTETGQIVIPNKRLLEKALKISK